MKREEVGFPLRMPSEVHEAVQLHARILGKSMNAVINDAVVAHLSSASAASEVKQLMQDARRDYRVALDKLKDL